MALHLTSQAFEPDQPIPETYSQDGANQSPPLSWQGAPEPTAEFALVVDDPDAPTAEPFVHWLLYKIPAGTDHIQAGVPQSPEPPSPTGARQGVNSADDTGYDGPAPPKGYGTHHYHFKLYALDAELDLSSRVGKQDLLAAMEGHVLEQAELIGTYQR